MPTTTPMSLKDFFKTIGNNFDPTKAPIRAPGSRTQALPNGGGSFQTPTAAPYGSPDFVSPIGIKSLYGESNGADNAGPVPTGGDTVLGPVKPPVSGGGSAAPVKRVFSGGAPATTTPPTTDTGALDYSKYINPATGKPYTPQEYAEVVAGRLTSPSVPKYAGDVLTEGPQTAEQLAEKARLLNNERNDIATGATDPYKIASMSGLQLNPTQLDAIEKAYAGVYTPALEDVFSAISKKEKADAAEKTKKEQADKAALDFKNDLEKMKVQFEYDKALKRIAPAGSGSGSGNSNQMTDNERAAQTLFQNNPIVKDYNTVIGQKNALDRVVANGVGGPADVNAIFNFMKALDPNSVVRESEYDKAAASGNIFQGAFTKFNGYFKDKGGFLPDNVRQEFQNLVDQKLLAQQAAYQNVANQTREIVKRQGLNPDNVVIDFSGGIENIGNNAPAVDPEWINKPDYNNDLKLAKEAIANGANKDAVKARLLTKYKQVDL